MTLWPLESEMLIIVGIGIFIDSQQSVISADLY